MKWLLCLILGMTAAQAADIELKAGLARVKITPSALMQMYGYSNPTCGPANGTPDPLFAKALVLEAGGAKVAIVTFDLGSMVSDKLREEVQCKLSIPVVLFAASHTHSGPSFLPYGSNPSVGELGDSYQAELHRKVFGAVEQASRTMF